MLKSVARPDGSEVTFTYDALGRRLSKTYRGQTTRWVWDGNVPLHEWVEGELQPLVQPSRRPMWMDGLTQQREMLLSAHLTRGPPARGTFQAPITWVFEPESFAPMAKLVGGERLSIVTDHLGVPIAMLDAMGEEVWSAQIGTWGDLRRMTAGDAQDCPFRWPGQYEDIETGLYYNRFRYYDREAGSYVSQDPIGLAGGPALYGYADTPEKTGDPHGLTCRSSLWNQFQRAHAGEYSSRAEAAAAYRLLLTGQSPWPDGFVPRARTLPAGTRFNMAMSPGQPSARPGGFGTIDNIPDEAYVRMKLAVKVDWKPQIDRVVTYETTRPVRVLEGPVGPQLDQVSGRYLPGGGHQIQLVEPGDRMNYLNVVSERSL